MGTGNVIVGQSGGPTAVINSSLAGVYKTAHDLGANKIFGMLNGIEGLIENRFVNLSQHIKTDLDIELLKRTPSSFLGSCRYKLPEPTAQSSIFKDIFKFFDQNDIKHCIYIGGNDSMDTIMKLDAYATLIEHSTRFIGVPKTIDNDLAGTDHTPGFGSAAKFIATTLKEIIRDSLVYGTNQVTIVEIMGRNAGWLTAAASLSKCEDCEGPDMIFLPEIPFHIDIFLDKIRKLRETKPSKSIVIAVSEGLKAPDGRYVCELNQTAKTIDPFGHKALGGAAFALADIVARTFDCKTRPIELSTLQRCSAHAVSRVDITEAFQVGGQAVQTAFAGKTGKVVVLKRVSSDPYISTTETVAVEQIANIEKKVPRNWITEDGTYVTKELTDYIRPLIQAELSPIMVNGLPRHLLLQLEK